MNQLNTTDYTIFLLYFIGVSAYGYWIYKRKQTTKLDTKDFFLAEGSLTWWAIGASLIASNISAEQFIGMSGSGFQFGVAIAVYEWLAAVCLIIVAIWFMPIYLKNHIYPALGATPLPKITEDVIGSWYANLLRDRPTLRARTYALLRTILGDAVPKYLPTNPCHIRGAGNTKPVAKTTIATPAQVVELATAMPDRLALTVLLGAWAQLRNGEVLELRRKDVTPTAIAVTRGVTWVDGHANVGPPKTDAGVRSPSSSSCAASSLELA